MQKHVWTLVPLIYFKQRACLIWELEKRKSTLNLCERVYLKKNIETFSQQLISFFFFHKGSFFTSSPMKNTFWKDPWTKNEIAWNSDFVQNIFQKPLKNAKGMNACSKWTLNELMK